jgi:hypothetical protein
MANHVVPVVMNHVVLCWASRLGITNWTLCLWVLIMLCYAEPVAVNHCELCWASGCETLCAIPRYWLWIILSYAEPVVVNHCVKCWAGYVGIMVCYAGSVVVNHSVNDVPVGVNHCAMQSQWLWITLCYVVPVGVNHGELCGGSGCESCCVVMCQ